MLPRRLPTPQPARPPWGTNAPRAAASLTLPDLFRSLPPLRSREQPRRAKGTQRNSAARAPSSRSGGGGGGGTGGSIYDKLFPGVGSHVRRRAELSRRDDAPSQRPLRSSLMRGLKAWGWEKEKGEEVVGAEDKASRLPGAGNQVERHAPGGEEVRQDRAGDRGREDESHDGPYVLVLRAASKSLLESDFYRLGRQGKHLDGWAAGIIKVVQARSPITHKPLGKYLIHFDTRAAAMAYLDEVIRLLSLSRKAAGHGWSVVSRDPTGPLPLATELRGATRPGESGGDANDAIRALSLVPPSAALSLKFGAPPNGDDGSHDAADAASHGAGDHNRVLVWLDGGQITADDVWEAIERDGADRNLPWRLERRGSQHRQQQEQAVAPLGAAGQPSNNGKERFGRFAVTFTDAGEARRFARNWHKRRLGVPGSDRTVVVNAVSLW